MPELPEVETVVRSLAPLVGRRIVAAEFRAVRILRGGDPDVLAGRLAGRRIAGVKRFGKFIGIRLDRGWLVVHLGMTGKLLVNGAFPRSQLYGLLRKAAEQKLFPLVLSDETNGDRTLEQGAKSYFRRMGLDADEGLLNLGVLGNAPLAYSLAFTAALWDYVEPLPGADTPGERTA